MKFTMYHSCITVLNLEKSIEFYEKALGLSEIRRMEGDDYKIVFLGTVGNPCQLELTWHADRKEPYDLGDNEIHVGFRVDDFEAAKKHHEEMGCICFDNSNLGVYFIEDPDGYWMEIIPTR